MKYLPWCSVVGGEVIGSPRCSLGAFEPDILSRRCFTNCFGLNHIRRVGKTVTLSGHPTGNTRLPKATALMQNMMLMISC